MYYFSKFIASFLQKLSFSLSFIFCAFTKYKSLAFLLTLLAAVYIMQYPSYQDNRVRFNGVNRPVNSNYKVNVFNRSLTFLNCFSGNVNVAVHISINRNTIVCGKTPSGNDSYYIETSQLICSSHQLTGLCMVRVFKKVIFKQSIM